MDNEPQRAADSDDLSLKDILATTLTGMRATMQQAVQKEVTEFYPEQRPTLPWGAKGQLYVDILDCISCFKCSDACPSDCIRIDVVRAPTGTLSDTSDGHKRMFEVMRFDIDMGQCCYCGLCTGRSSYVPANKQGDVAALAFADRTATCPTDCINFYPKYENGCEDPNDMVYHFSNYSYDEARARWNMMPPNRCRSTHPEQAQAELAIQTPLETKQS